MRDHLGGHSGAEGIVIGVGASGRLRAISGTAYPDNRSWHLSTAGRATDQRTPPVRNDTAAHLSDGDHTQGAVLVAAGVSRFRLRTVAFDDPHELRIVREKSAWSP